MAHGNLRREPSAGFVMFRLCRSSPPCRPLSPGGPGRHLRVHDPDEFVKTFAARERLSSLDELLELRQPGAIVVPALTDKWRKNDSLWVVKVTIFDEPSGSATFARGRSPTVAPRGRGPTPTGRTLEKQRSVKKFMRKRLPRRSEVGVIRRCFVTRVVALFANALTSPRFYRRMNSAKLPPYIRWRGGRVAFTLTILLNLHQLV